MTVVARRELGAQVAFLASASPDAARRLAVDVRRAFELLGAGNVEGPEAQLRDGRYVRRWIVPPLLLFYERDGRDVLVRRVRHGAQRPITRG
jgi:plasmid stabilization system protein ParE